jgi:1,4-dihydroxy-2-naphthoate octaprenyltransferase
VGLRTFAAIVELRTKVVSVTSFSLGTLAAIYAGARPSWPLTALMFAAVLCVDMGTTAFNSFFDYERQVDDPRFNRESDKVLVHAGVAPGWALLTGLGLYALAVPLGFLLAVLRGWVIAVVGTAGMVVGYRYNGGARPISHTPFGELFAGGFLGSGLFLLSYYVQALTLPRGAWIGALPPLLLVASILTVNNTCDIEGDRSGGRLTLSILVGPAAAEAVIYGLGIAAYTVSGLEVAEGILPPVAVATLAAAFFYTLLTYCRMHRRGFSHATKGPSMGAISRVLTAYGLGAGSALAAASLMR